MAYRFTRHFCLVFLLEAVAVFTADAALSFVLEFGKQFRVLLLHRVAAEKD